MDKVKNYAYLMILNHSATNAKGQEKDFNYIVKASNKIIKNLKMELHIKGQLLARLENVKNIINEAYIDDEMLCYVVIDYLIKVFKCPIARNKFLHIDTNSRLSKWEKEYPKELRELYNLIAKIEDNL